MLQAFPHCPMARNNGHADPDRRDGLVLADAPAIGLYGRPGWVAALTPLPVDGMIVAASTALLADWRGECRRDRRRRITEPWISTEAAFGHRPRWRWPPRTPRGRSTTRGPRTDRQGRA